MARVPSASPSRQEGQERRSTRCQRTLMNPNSVSLGDIHVGISSLDKIVGKDEHTSAEPEKGTFQDWQLILADPKSNNLNCERNNRAFSEGDFEQDGYCAQRRHNALKVSRRIQMNEHEQSDMNRASRESCDTTADRRSMELHFDEEYSVTPSERKRSWLHVPTPTTILTCMSPGRSEAGVPSQVTCDDVSSAHALESFRKNWYERPDSLKGHDCLRQASSYANGLL